MTPYYQAGGITLYVGDCREVIPGIEAPFDYILTDPPYGLGFMGKDWDRGIPGPHFWEIIRAACKPGAICLAFGGPRTFHRLTCAIEDAGFEIRDCIMWVYGSGLTKSLDISKAIDKAAGAEREIIGRDTKWRNTAVSGAHRPTCGEGESELQAWDITVPATPEAEVWNGWGTALKPAWEPIMLAMNPIEGTFADNALTHGVAGLNVDGGRVDANGELGINTRATSRPNGTGYRWQGHATGDRQGRFPANLIHDGSDEVVGLFPVTCQVDKRKVKIQHQALGRYGIYGRFSGAKFTPAHNDTGSAARFFYCAKASRSERGKGNNHPTVKPLALLSYLLTLLQTPTGGRILDPFAGSGSTLVAARQAGREAVGIEISEEYAEITVRRIRAAERVEDEKSRQGVIEFEI